MAQSSSAESDLLLTFGQSTVYVSDLETLGAGQWLNDTIIGFAYDILSCRVCKDAPKNSLLFVHPTTVNVIKFENDEEDLVPLIAGAGMQSHDLLFFPISNSKSMLSVGGSHWSLLLYERHSNAFYHLDSAGAFNLAHARNFANKVYPHLEKKQKGGKAEEEQLEQKQADIDFVKVLGNLIKLKVPQQANGFDCGLYVVEFSQFVAEFVLEAMAKGKEAQSPSISDLKFGNGKEGRFGAKNMLKMRKKWQRVIGEMAKEQKAKK